MKAQKQHVRRSALLFFVILLINCLIPSGVCADTGPKPSVQIQFQDMGDELCYGTLLSESISTGPATAWDGSSPYESWQYGEDGKEIWEAFVSYKDTNGFYFLQEWWECSESKCLNWGYYPPNPFKILLYYPKTNTFAVSEICQRYAFDSYYTVDMRGVAASRENETIALPQPQRSYDYTWEMISLLIRILITILLEIVMAVVCGFREKKVLRLIIGINILTQTVLNAALNMVNYLHGYQAFVLQYIIFEILVFVLEAILYCIFFPKVSERKFTQDRIIGYAFLANLLSFAGGMLIAKAIPGIF